MAHLVHPTYTRRIPSDAARITVKGVPCVRWKSRGGQVVTAAICANPDRCRVTITIWHVRYKDANGRSRVEEAYTDRAASEALLAEIVIREARIQAKVLPPEAAKARAPLAELIAEFRRHLHDAGRSERYARDRSLYVDRVTAAAGILVPAELTPAKVVRAVAQVREDLDLAPLTAGYHVSAVKQFTRWLALCRKSETTDHLSGLRCELDTAHPVITRRALTEAEFRRFIATTRRSMNVRRGLTGRERSMLYLVAASTGLRAAELAALTPRRFALDVAPPSVTALAAYAKGRRTDALPIPDSLVKELRAFLKGRPVDEPVWPSRTPGKWGKWRLKAREIIERDLRAAGIEFETPAGRYDFHSLRVQFATDLARAGADLSDRQKLMRHSTPKLTSNTYTRLAAPELAAVANRLRRSRTA